MDKKHTDVTSELRQKLEVIQKITGLTQTKLAEKLSVSFVAFNRWWTGKSVPRPKAQAAIEELFLEVTGQKAVSENELLEKKRTCGKTQRNTKTSLLKPLRTPIFETVLF
jgi:transcriptional regulator with XRE-family HTH domain